MRKALNTNWFTHVKLYTAEEDRSGYLDRKQDVAIITISPPFDINESTAPACIKLSNQTYEHFDYLGGKTCYSSYYKKTGSSVKLMYSPLLMMNSNKVRNDGHCRVEHNLTSKKFPREKRCHFDKRDALV